MSRLKSVAESGVEAGSYLAVPHIFDRQFIDDARKLFEKAKKAATTKMDSKRINYFSRPVDMLELYLDYVDASQRFDFVSVNRHYEAMLSLWDQVDAMNTELVSRYPRKWYHKSFLGKFATLGKQYSTGEYSIVEPLPDRLKAMLDPYNTGQEMNYQHPDLNDEDFFEVATYSTTFEKQGLAGQRDGAIWYRHHFRIKPEHRAESIGLFVGGVEDEVNVFINGEYVGFSRGFPGSSVFDLSDGIRLEEENVLALQVVRRGKLNETGHGGIIRPSFLFAGPKRKEKAPNQNQVGRVLPGGLVDESSY